ARRSRSAPSSAAQSGLRRYRGGRRGADASSTGFATWSMAAACLPLAWIDHGEARSRPKSAGPPPRRTVQSRPGKPKFFLTARHRKWPFRQGVEGAVAPAGMVNPDASGRAGIALLLCQPRGLLACGVSQRSNKSQGSGVMVVGNRKVRGGGRVQEAIGRAAAAPWPLRIDPDTVAGGCRRLDSGDLRAGPHAVGAVGPGYAAQ